MEPLSQSKPITCPLCLSQSDALPLCSHCFALLPVPDSVNYFDVLGLPMALFFEEDLLRERFYRMAKLVHPDRYSTKANSQKDYATQWTTLLNKSFQTLKDPVKTAHYLIDTLAPEVKAAKAQIPTDLANAYFELEEEGADPASVQALLHAGHTKLNALVFELRDPLPHPISKEYLTKLSNNLATQKYLQSLIENLERKLQA